MTTSSVDDVDDILDDLQGRLRSVTSPVAPASPPAIQLRKSSSAVQTVHAIKTRSQRSSTVCAEPVQEIKGWYHGPLQRDEVDRLLSSSKPGSFLIRDSLSSKGDYVLSVKENPNIANYMVRFQNGVYSINDLEFSDLAVLIDHFKRNRIGGGTLKEAVIYTPLEQREKAHSILSVSSYGSHGREHSGSIVSTMSTDSAISTTSFNGRMLVRALYDFSSEDSQDLPFMKGDILCVLENDSTWWLAQNNAGKKGKIPSNYVEVVTPGGKAPALPSPRLSNSHNAVFRKTSVRA
eukprot:Colp12_sorted_trinity150504_noHs@32209